MSVVTALYLVLLAAVAGYVLAARVPSLLHTPMLSGSNFIHGIVLVGSMLALSRASGTLETVIGFIAVMAASANVVGGFAVTDRMLNLFKNKDDLEPVTALNDAVHPSISVNAEQRASDNRQQSDSALSSTSSTKGDQ